MGSSSKTIGVTYHTSIVLKYNKIIQPLSNAYSSYHRPLIMGYLRQVALLALLASAYCKPMDRNEDEIKWSMENQENPDEIVESEHLFEGDMMLTKEQLALLNGETDRVVDLSGDGSKKLGGKWPADKTTKLVNVPFTIDANNKAQWSKTQLGIWNKALKVFATKTCVRFVPRKTEANYIYVKNGGGCYTQVGMNTGKQVLSLNARCLNEVGTPTHELMHVLGFMHEQSRKDRDKYVTVNKTNIRSNMLNQFAICKTCDTNGLPYDTGSVMHYGAYAFSKNEGGGLWTIKAKDGSKLGQDNGPSKRDIQGINKVYCGGKTAATSKPGATTAAPATTKKAATAAPTTTRPQTGRACRGNLFAFWGGWGGCWSYSKNLPSWMKSNNAWCKTHYDKRQKLYASDVCPECGCTRK